MVKNNSINKRTDVLNLVPQGTGAGATGELRFLELAAGGSNFVSLKAADTLGADYTYTLPTSYGTSGHFLQTNGSGTMTWAAASGGGAVMSQNVIINPEMQFNQRAASYTVNTNGVTRTLDRWRVSRNGTMAYSVAPSTDVPSVSDANYLFTNSLLATVTTAQASIGANDGLTINQIVEGYIYAPIAQRTMTLSFWVKSSITGTYCVAFINSGADRSYVAEYTINVADTWEYKTITVTASPSAGTWNYTTGIGIGVYFTLAGGTSIQTTPGAWQTGNFIATSNQVNHTGTLGATFRLEGVKLETGSTANAFEGRLFTDELFLCNRYYEKSYNLTTYPGTVSSAGVVYFGFALNSTFFYGSAFVNFVAKRTVPTVTLYNEIDGTTGMRNLNTNASTAYATGVGQAGFYAASPAAMTTNVQYTGQFTLEAEF